MEGKEQMWAGVGRTDTAFCASLPAGLTDKKAEHANVTFHDL